MLDSLKIKNYRCIDEFEMNDIKPITIFVGRNNTGKSSILECVSLICSASNGFYDSLGNDLYENIVRKRGGEEYLDKMIKIGETNAHIEAISNNIMEKIDINRDGIKIRNGYEFYYNDAIDRYIEVLKSRLEYDLRRTRVTLSQRESVERRMDLIQMQLDDLKKDILNYVEFFIEYYNEDEKKFEFVLHLSDSFINKLGSIIEERYIRFPTEQIIRTTESNKSNTVFMVEPTFDYLKELQRRIAKSGDLIRVLRRLRRTIPNFEDIREVEDNFVIYLRNSETPLPLQAMGDGFQARLAILSGLSTIRKGFSILEEPETKLHPGYMMSIVEEILNTVNNIQYFISTHNIEFIEMMLDKNTNLVNIVRLFKIEGQEKLDYEILNGEEALEEIDVLKLDLRGI